MIKFGELREDRIGHLAGNTELFYRTMERDGWPKRTNFIFLAWHPANRQLLEMWKREIRVIEGKFFRRAFIALRPWLARTPFYFELPELPVAEHPAFYTGTPALRFTAEEEQRGRDELKNMGVDSWFVCFHARDESYIAKREGFGGTENQASYFDCSIENYIDAMRYVASLGGYAIRVGASVSKPLPDLGPRIIDYASNYRSDFMDIYLPAHCKFFVANTSGIFNISRIFNVPYILTNLCPYPWVGMSGPRNLDIPKLLRRKSDGHVFTFKEAKDMGLLECHRDEPARLRSIFKEQTYNDLGFDWIENTPDEITDAVRDMLDKIEGREPSEAGKALQAKFRALYNTAPKEGGIGPRFAIKHARLIS